MRETPGLYAIDINIGSRVAFKILSHTRLKYKVTWEDLPVFLLLEIFVEDCNYLFLENPVELTPKRWDFYIFAYVSMCLFEVYRFLIDSIMSMIMCAFRCFFTILFTVRISISSKFSEY